MVLVQPDALTSKSWAKSAFADKALNNTSLIILFRIGSKYFLFPGDAQWENWEYALSKKPWMKKLAAVDVYKVGHHGSLNATPTSLWKNFANKNANAADPNRMKSLMSTLAGKHGHVEDDTEVPRRTLVTALEKETTLFTTQTIRPADTFYHDTKIDVA